jgi:hypothetical protein
VNQHHTGESQETHEHRKGLSPENNVGDDASRYAGASQNKPENETFSTFGHVFYPIHFRDIFIPPPFGAGLEN